MYCIIITWSMSDYNIPNGWHGNGSFPFYVDLLFTTWPTRLSWIWLYVTRRVSYKKQELSTLWAPGLTPGFFGEVRAALVLFCVCCVFVLLVKSNVDCISGLFIFDCPFGYLKRLLLTFHHAIWENINLFNNIYP